MTHLFGLWVFDSDNTFEWNGPVKYGISVVLLPLTKPSIRNTLRDYMFLIEKEKNRTQWVCFEVMEMLRLCISIPYSAGFDFLPAFMESVYVMKLHIENHLNKYEWDSCRGINFHLVQKQEDKWETIFQQYHQFLQSQHPLTTGVLPTRLLDLRNTTFSVNAEEIP